MNDESSPSFFPRFTTDHPSIEGVHGLSDYRRACRRVFSDSDSPDDQSNCHDRAGNNGRSNLSPLPTTRTILLAEPEEPVHARRAGCGVIDSGIREGDLFGFALPRTATLRARRDSGREDHRSAPKPALEPIRVLSYRPNGPAHLNGNFPRILLSDEPVIQRAITLVQGKWRIAILRHLQDGPVRVGELNRRMRSISKKVLNQHLRRMQKEALVLRTETNGKIPHVEYALTNPLGRSVIHLLRLIAQWDAQT